MQPTIRIGDAERDQVMAALRDHFARGRLTRDELDERLDATLAARTAGDLSRVTADLPGPGLPSPGHVRRQGHRRGFPMPLIPLIVVGLIIAAIAAGPGLVLLAVLKVMFFAWLAFMLIGAFGARRFARHHGRRSRYIPG